MWLTEISLPDIYTANKGKLGDILMTASAGDGRTQAKPKLVWGWLPGVQIAYVGQELMAAPTGPFKGHIPMLRPPNVLGPYVEW